MEFGAVTLLDVLGWKGIWQRKEDGIASLMELIEKADQRAKSVLSFDKHGGSPNPFADLQYEMISISDTIALVTYGNCTNSLEFHGGVCTRIVKESILKGIPVRGATCYGLLSNQHNILVGPAIDEVASWYEEADWIGVMQTPSAYLTNNENYHYGNKYLVEYHVPIKHGGKFYTYCANWPELFISEEGDDESKIRGPLLDMGPITPDIFPKFNGALEFYRAIKKEITGKCPMCDRMP